MSFFYASVSGNHYLRNLNHLRNMSYRIWTSVSLKAGLYIGTEMNKILSFILYERVFYSNPFFQINPDIGKPFMPTA
ncbi:hypothetical protein, partial [Bacteroides acidifaciens]|uniref:hypothetical protein n=2 Tax=Bacteroides acidifaciens TaxID=85831 RepID=UPI0025A653CF